MNVCIAWIRRTIVSSFWAYCGWSVRLGRDFPRYFATVWTRPYFYLFWHVCSSLIIYFISSVNAISISIIIDCCSHIDISWETWSAHLRWATSPRIVSSAWLIFSIWCTCGGTNILFGRASWYGYVNRRELRREAPSTRKIVCLWAVIRWATVRVKSLTALAEVTVSWCNWAIPGLSIWDCIDPAISDAPTAAIASWGGRVSVRRAVSLWEGLQCFGSVEQSNQHS